MNKRLSSLARSILLRPARLALAGACVIPGASLAMAGGGWAIAPAGSPPPAGLPSCAFGEQPARATRYDQWAYTVLDPGHTLGRAYHAPDLRTDVVGTRSVPLRRFVFEPLRAMLGAAARDGVRVEVNSGHRTYDEQVELRHVYRGGDDLVARPGHSEHQLGTAVDLDGGRTWLRDNSWRYGFVLSYPAGRSDWSCYRPEPWHFRYFGLERARQIHESGLSPREFLWAELNGEAARA